VAPQSRTQAIEFGRLFYKEGGFGLQLILLIAGITIVFSSHLLFLSGSCRSKSDPWVH
jgi:hypothetical protein